MPAAIAVPAIVGIGSSVASLVGAKMSSNASQKAAAQQVAATNKAQAFNQQAYTDQKTALAPYQQMGQQSLGALMARYGQSDPSALASRASGFVQAAQGGGPTRPNLQAGMPPQGQSLGAAMQGGPMRSVGSGMTLAAQQAQPSQSGMVLMEGPDGTRASVPQANVQKALGRGARVVES
jgi:hypothetical protein